MNLVFKAVQVIRTRLARGPCGYTSLCSEVGHETGLDDKQHHERLAAGVLDALDQLLASGEVSRVTMNTSQGDHTVFRLGRG